jgi:hypothetical protein
MGRLQGHDGTSRSSVEAPRGSLEPSFDGQTASFPAILRSDAITGGTMTVTIHRLPALLACLALAACKPATEVKTPETAPARRPRPPPRPPRR